MQKKKIRQRKSLFTIERSVVMRSFGTKFHNINGAKDKEGMF